MKMIFEIAIVLSLSALCSAAFAVDGRNHSCYRGGVCIDNDRRVCEYEFHVEWFQTLTAACVNCPTNPADCFGQDCVAADGFERIIQVVNRKMPGPSIEVCDGDEVIVRVFNGMHEDTTSIHWHGMHQRGTQFMDGVPFVTQCPINPDTLFTYRFRAAFGTHWWHSHTGVQRGNGIFGALIVRRKQSLERNLYNYLLDYVITIQDWTEDAANEVFIKRYFDKVDENPRSLLINGLGRFVDGTGTTRGVPAARFECNRPNFCRFRLIQATYMDVPVVFSIDGHKFQIIASDGADIQPVVADSLTLYSGERYDIVFTCNTNAPSLVWMRFQGLVQGELGQTHTAAVMQCSSAVSTAYPVATSNFPNPTWASAGVRPGQLQVNGFNSPPNNIPVCALRAAVHVDVTGVPLKRIYIAYDIKDKNVAIYQPAQPTEIPLFNDIALELFSFPLLSQKDEVNETRYCNGDTVPAAVCKTQYCRCPHIIKLPFGALVELVLIDEGVKFDVAHSIHLHGHYFQVLSCQKLGTFTTENQVRQSYGNGSIQLNFSFPPTKDTVQVPDGGYTIIRFYANNLGFWFLHCHLDFHMELGMALVFQVGERWQMPSAPPGFPRCGDYTNPPPPPLA